MHFKHSIWKVEGEIQSHPQLHSEVKAGLVPNTSGWKIKEVAGGGGVQIGSTTVYRKQTCNFYIYKN